MKTTTKIRQTWQVDLTIEPGDEIPDYQMPWESTVIIRPDHATLHFERSGGGAIEWESSHISGMKVKQDGTPGKQRSRNSFYPGSMGLPAWLRTLAEEQLALIRADWGATSGDDLTTAHHGYDEWGRF